MAPTNVELARGSFEALAAREVDAYIGFFSEDVDWRVSAFVTGKDRYPGHDGIREFLADVARLYDEHGEQIVAKVTEFSEVDADRVLGLGEGRIVREENPLEFETGCIYRIAGGKITEFEGYTSHDEARKAAGLD